MLTHKKIRFIEPRGRPGRPFNAWIGRWPMLGPITLATLLKERGYDATVYNENISGSLFDNPSAYDEIRAADVVGISIMTSTANRGYTIADRIKREGSAAKVVFGGSHATFMPHEALAHGDVVVCGEGETVIEPIVKGEISSGIIKAVPLEDLDSIPTLDHSVMYEFEKLPEGLRRELYELPVMTSRGCPHGCTYCSVTRMFGRKVRRQSVDKVYRDVCKYVERGFRRLMFYDDNFTTDREWSRQLLERLRPLGLRFNAQVRADFHWRDAARREPDRELLRLMNQAGGDMLFVGYETVDESTAREWRKGYRGRGSLETRLLQDTRILHDSDFWIHGMFVVGPQHTENAVRRIANFARSADIETLQISILTPFPGTPLFDQMRPHLMLHRFPGDWDFYDGTHCVFDHGCLGVRELQKVVLEAHSRFYRYGLSLRRLRGTLRDSIPLRDRIAMLWRHVRIAHTTMREWKKETASFLELVKNLQASRVT